MPRKKRAERLAEKLAETRAPVDFSALSTKGITMFPAEIRRGYYEDKPFTCVDCKAPQVWTATQQKWWFEVAKGYTYSYAQRCRPCRAAARAKKAAARAASGHTKKTK